MTWNPPEVQGSVIADSPYKTDEAPLTPGGGVAAGAAASLLMLLVIVLLQPHSGLSARDLLIRIGDTVFPRMGAARSGSFVWASGAFFTAVGAVLGLLYAVSQDRIPVPGLAVVGVFYGVVIWVLGRVLTSWLLGPALRPALHSYPWFLACLAYGAFLAGCAAWADRRRPASTAVGPID